jgi:hypothetical protein
MARDMACEVLSMNSFRSALENGTAGKPPAPLMPEKRPSATGDHDSLTSLSVNREARRTVNHRDGDRHRLATEQVKLKAGRKSYDVDLVNLSGGGAMIRTDAALDMWQKVHLLLGERDGLECAVRWIRGDRVGLEFAHETQIGGDPDKRDAMLLEVIKRSFPDAKPQVRRDDHDMAPPPAAPRNQRRAALRHPLIWSGHILWQHDSVPVRLRNISETGAQVDSNVPFPPYAEVMLDLGGAGQQFARVSWSRGDQVGLQFDQPFDIAKLAKTKPQVSDHRWSTPEYLRNAPQDDSAWAKDWQAGSLSDLREDLEGFLKR